jgi:hypothetical protein
LYQRGGEVAIKRVQSFGDDEFTRNSSVLPASIASDP